MVRPTARPRDEGGLGRGLVAAAKKEQAEQHGAGYQTTPHVPGRSLPGSGADRRGSSEGAGEAHAVGQRQVGQVGAGERDADRRQRERVGVGEHERHQLGWNFFLNAASDRNP